MPMPDAERAFVQAAAAISVADLPLLRRRGGALHRLIARQQRAGIVHHRHARRDVAATWRRS